MEIFNSKLLVYPMKNGDLPIENGDFPQFFVCLPEGKWDIVPETICNSRTSTRICAALVSPPGKKRWELPVVESSGTLPLISVWQVIFSWLVKLLVIGSCQLLACSTALPASNCIQRIVSHSFGKDKQLYNNNDLTLTHLVTKFCLNRPFVPGSFIRIQYNFYNQIIVENMFLFLQSKLWW